MAARGFILKTMFLPNLVSRLQHRLFLPSKISIPLAVSNGKIILLNCWARTWTKIVMLMLRSIVPAINLENGSKQLLFKFLSFFLLRQLHLSGIYGSLPLPLVLLTTTAKRKHYSRVIRGYSRFFAWNCGLYWSADRFHACAKCDLARSRF